MNGSPRRKAAVFRRDEDGAGAEDPPAPRDAPAPARGLHAYLVLGVRLVLGALFAFSAWSKLEDPQGFAFALKAFKLGLPDHLLPILAYAVPWAEALAGVLLILGAWTSAAAALVLALMLLFIGAIALLLSRGLAVDCPCFGSLQLVCEGPLGPCHIARNVLIATGASYVILDGPGAWSMDRTS